MSRLLGPVAVLIGMATTLTAAGSPVPEIDGSMTIAALALLGGGLLVIRARRKKTGDRDS